MVEVFEILKLVPSTTVVPSTIKANRLDGFYQKKPYFHFPPINCRQVQFLLL